MPKNIFIGAIAGAILFVGCATTQNTTRDTNYPLLDSVCEEYASLGAQTEELPHDVTLYLFQDASYVWLCAALPPESFGTADIIVGAPGLDAPLNLHVSAQVGEWAADSSETAPQTAESEKWWQVDGWFAVPVRMNGMGGEGEDRFPRFIPSEGREFQISKKRFGRGDWKLKIEFRGIRTADGENASVTFPEPQEQFYILKVD